MLYSDNAAVCSIVSKGSMKRELQRLALDIFYLCIQYSIHLELEWLPRELNDISDYFSRILDFYEMGIAAVLFEIVRNGDLLQWTGSHQIIMRRLNNFTLVFGLRNQQA